MLTGLQSGMGHRLIPTLVVVLLVAAPRIVAQQPSSPWPPPGVLRVADADTPPRAVKKQSADYTPDAMRLGIQGVVGLSCVVNADGSVGEVRVTRSLDALHGLDVAAIAAAKQWQYSPATKNGKPVPVVVTIEMSFQLGPETSSYFTWPAGFSGSTSGVGWKAMDLESNETKLHIEYPDSWAARRDASPRELVTLQSADSAATAVIEPLTVSNGSYIRPFSPEQLKSIADKMTPGARSFGQVSAQGRVWVWTESAALDSGSTWRFQTLVDDTAVNVTMAIHGARDELSAQLGSMLRRMTIKSKL